MARPKKYHVTFSCGHDGVVYSTRQAGADYTARRDVCEDCTARHRAEQAEQAAQTNAELGRPPLVGTDKQIAWAECIRAVRIPEMERIGAELRAELKPEHGDYAPMVDRAIAVLCGNASAGWWIDNSDRGIRTQIADLAYAYIKDGLPVAEELLKSPAPHVLMSPEGRDTIVTEPATISVSGQKVLASYPVRHEIFVSIAKACGMEWDKSCWELICNARTGAASHRAAELAHRLLAAGFLVRIDDDEARAMTLAGDYEPRHWRWVCKHNKTGKLLFEGGPGDDFAAVHSLPGARWDRDYRCRLVPPSSFDAVDDFAERYGFKVSEGAAEAMAAARAERAAAIGVTPVRKSVEQPDATAGMPKLPSNPDVEIDNDLRDPD